MSAAVSISFCKPEFSDFLYALIAENDDDGHLTVLSALSRLDLDPWMAAEVLSAMPKDVAVGRLATLITQLPTASWKNADANGAARRLIGLLPSKSDGAAPAKSGGAARPSTMTLVWIALGLAAVVLVTNVSRSMQAAGDADEAARVTTDAPQTLPQ